MRSVAWLFLCFFAVEGFAQNCAPLALKRASVRVEYDQSESATGRSTAILFEPLDTGALRARMRRRAAPCGRSLRPSSGRRAPPEIS